MNNYAGKQAPQYFKRLNSRFLVDKETNFPTTPIELLNFLNMNL